MLVVTYKKIFFAIAGITTAFSIGSIAVFGLTFGIDFTGGALTEVTYPDGRPDKAAVEERLQALALGGFSLRETGNDGYILKSRDLSEGERQAVVEALSRGGEVALVEERFNSIGPVIGQELRNKAFIAIGVMVIAIIFFVAFVFRHVSETVSSWKYGLIAIVALLHDIIIPVGVFALLGHLFAAEIDVLFVMALLAILGYSVNDTIVVFDRVRENVRLNKEAERAEDFELTVGKSLNQTYMRSLNTSLTTLFVVLMLFFLGAPATQNFALVLLAGVVAGTYSSIFLATPLLVVVGKTKKK